MLYNSQPTGKKGCIEKKSLDKIGEIMITSRHAIDTGRTDTCCRFTFSPVRSNRDVTHLDQVQDITKKDVMKITGGTDYTKIMCDLSSK